MTSQEYDQLAVDTLKRINYRNIKDVADLANIAQVYATLSVAAAQREWNDMSRDNYGAACVRTYQKG